MQEIMHTVSNFDGGCCIEFLGNFAVTDKGKPGIGPIYGKFVHFFPLRQTVFVVVYKIFPIVENIRIWQNNLLTLQVLLVYNV
ncbi:MAG: hypothetical protein J6Q92_00520 [Oscillospiraceae bacterium]|nr:hypothetical protein [Oscillospiraceae bacterium]